MLPSASVGESVIDALKCSLKSSELFIDAENDGSTSAEGSFSVQGPGLFEPIHSSAPDIAGQVEMTFNFKTVHLDTTLAFNM